MKSTASAARVIGSLVLAFAFFPVCPPFSPGMSASSSIDLASAAYHTRYWAVSFPKILAVLALMTLDGGLKSYGFKRPGARTAITAVALFGALAVLQAILGMAGNAFPSLPSPKTTLTATAGPGFPLLPVLFAFLTSAVTGALEEFLFRAFLVSSLSKANLPAPAVFILQALSFTLPHASNGLMAMAFAFLASCAAFAAFVRSRDAIACAAGHGMHNFAVSGFVLIRSACS